MGYKNIQHHSHARILALDLHPRRFGYVVMESPDKLLDWGVRRSYQKTNKHTEVLVGGRIRRLVKMWMPDVIVTRIRDRRDKVLQSFFRQIKREVGTTAFLPIQNSPDHVSRGKYERAVQIAARFPEIAWKLPSRRRPWESEHYSMSIFGALEVAVACIA